MRLLDLECEKCGKVLRDVFLRKVPRKLIHNKTDKTSRCQGVMEQVFLPSNRGGQWSDKDAVVVFKKADGSISYPARNDLKTPKGCERVVMRSLREVEKFEKEAGVRSEMAWFDKGSGRSFDDVGDASHLPSVQERFKLFQRAWHA